MPAKHVKCITIRWRLTPRIWWEGHDSITTVNSYSTDDNVVCGWSWRDVVIQPQIVRKM